MKKTIIVFLAVALLGFVMACRDHVPNESVKNDFSDKPEANIVVKQSINPLKAGEFHLEEKDFGEIIELQGERRSIKEIFRVAGSEMLIKDDILTIKNPIDTDMFMQYKLPELKFIRSFGKMGQGPGEFIYPSIVTTEEKTPLFYMFDGAKTGFCYLDRENQIKEIDFRFPHSFTEQRLFTFLMTMNWSMLPPLPKARPFFIAISPESRQKQGRFTIFLFLKSIGIGELTLALLPPVKRRIVWFTPINTLSAWYF